ncbi:MAG: glycosyltransferase [Promethearchaeota archaeon]|jgi:glycosyltransferase involved in cell wall biosynthesis
MERKKILMVTTFYPPYHVGGACTHVYYLANELAKRGHEIHILYSKDAYYLKRKNKPSLKSYPNHRNVHLHELVTPLAKIGPIYSYITGYTASVKKLKLFSQDYHLIHYHNISLLGPKIFQYGKVKKIYTAHDHWLYCPYNDYFTDGNICNGKNSSRKCTLCLMRNKRPPQVWRFSNLLRNSIKNIDLIISPSQYLKSFLIKNSIEQPIAVLPNLIPDPPKKLKSAPDRGYFFYAGMLEEIKGISNLLKVFQGIGRNLIIAGKGSLEKYVRNMASRNKNIRYVGWLDNNDIYSYYKNAQAFILPSLCPENCPLTVLEAFSVGTPALGSRVGGIPEIIAKVDNKLIFNPMDINEIKQKVMGFSKDNYSSKQIRNIFRKNYSSGMYIESYLQLVNNNLSSI